MKTFFITSFFFVLAQGIAIFTGYRLFTIIPLIGAADTAAFNQFSFFIGIIIAALIFIIAKKVFKPKHFHLALKIAFFMAIFSGFQFLFSAMNLASVLAFLAAVILALCYFYISFAFIRNILFAIAIGAVAGFIGAQTSSQDALIIMGLLVIYDFIAVYYTRHMVSLAKIFVEAKVIPGILIPIKTGSDQTPASRISLLGQYYILGGGDLAFPALFAASTLKIDYFVAASTLAGSFLGLVLLHKIFFSQKERKPMAALPPIAIGSLSGFIIGILIKLLYARGL